jgi:hypothetical protein
MPQGDADIRIGVLVEGDSDLIVLAPDRVAVAREMIAIDLKRELRWQSGRIGNVNARAARGDVSHRAVDGTAIAKRQPSALEYAVPGVSAPLDDVFAHSSHSHHCKLRESLVLADCGLINFDRSAAGYRFITCLR